MSFFYFSVFPPEISKIFYSFTSLFLLSFTSHFLFYLPLAPFSLLTFHFSNNQFRFFYLVLSPPFSFRIFRACFALISYPLFFLQGDLEQLAIVPTPSAVSQQCSATRIPLLDPALLQTTRSELNSGGRERRGRRTKGRKGADYQQNEPTARWKLTNTATNLEDSDSGTWKVTTSPPKKKPEYDDVNSEEKDPGTIRDITEGEDFFEDSDSEGSAQGEGQYGGYQ